MKVLLVNNQLWLGGAETVVHQLLSRIPDSRLLVAEAYDPSVEVMYPRLLSRLNHSRFHRLMERWFPTYEWTNRCFSRLRNDPADIIHIHNFHGTYAGVEALGELARTKRVVWTFHGLWGITGGCAHPKGCQGYLNHCGNCPQLGVWPIGNIDRTAQELARKVAALSGLSLHVVVPSKYFLREIRSSRVGARWNVHHIPLGVDVASFRPRQAESGPVKILIVNRDFRDPDKGFLTVKEALQKIEPIGLELTLVGLNSDWAINQLPKGFESRSLGYVADRDLLARLYCESHIFFFASAAENFPCSILEAMAAGACVVATPSGGVVEQIADGKNGFLASTISGPDLAVALGARVGID